MELHSLSLAGTPVEPAVPPPSFLSPRDRVAPQIEESVTSEPALVALLRGICERDPDDPELETYMAAGMDMFSHQPGRAALADLMVLYSRHEQSNGELPPVLFDHLARLLVAALAACNEHEDATTAAAYVRTVKLLFCVGDDGIERRLADETAVMQSPLWQNMVLLQEVALEALTAEKERTMCEFDVRDMSDMQRDARNDEEQKSALTVASIVLDLAVRSGGVGIEAAYEYVAHLQSRQILTDAPGIEMLETLLDQWTLQKLFGQVSGATALDWESSPYNRGQTHDRYGFKIDTKQPEFYVYACSQQERRRELNNEQAIKWRAYLDGDSVPGFRTDSGQTPDRYRPDTVRGDVSSLVRGGVPHEMRGEVWMQLAQRSRAALSSVGGKTYRQLVDEVAALEGPKSESVQTIDQDLPRTFPLHSFIDTEEALGELRNVLIAYSLRNPGVGYCQSMNFISAVMLIALQDRPSREEDAFWLLALLEENLLSHYHTAGMAGCQSDTRTLMTLTERYLPAIHDHFVRCSVMAEVAFVSWFLCLFFNVLPAETALRVWDCMFGVLAIQQASAPISVVFTEADTKLGLTFPAGVSPLVVDTVSIVTGQRHPELKAGLCVITVQGQRVAGLTYEETKSLIINAGRPLSLTFVDTNQIGVERNGGDLAARDLLLRVGLATLDMCSRQILAASDPHELNQVIRAAPSHLFDADALIERAFNPAWTIDPDIRAAHETDVESEQSKIDESRQTREHADHVRDATIEAKAWLERRLQEGLEDREEIIRCGGPCVVKLMDQQLHRGSLFVTTSRLLFVSREPQADDTALGALGPPRVLIETSLVSIANFCAKEKLRLHDDPTGFDFATPTLRVTCKDSQRLYFIFDQQLLLLMDMAEHDIGTIHSTIAHSCLKSLIFQLKTPGSALSKSLQRLTFSGNSRLRPGKEMQTIADVIQTLGDVHQRVQAEKWSFLVKPQSAPAQQEWTGAACMRLEWERQGLNSATSRWRATALNSKYELCPTYPDVFYVPASISDDDVREVAKFRSKQRLPVLSWIHPASHAAIVRCAQPLVGVRGQKSEADERLFALIASANAESQSIAMLDARPYLSAVANRGRGGGAEDVTSYQQSGVDASLVFLNIDNIHVMRDSLEAMHALVRKHPPADIPSSAGDCVWAAEVIATGWLAYVGRILSGARMMVSEVYDKNKTVVLHCSDGWDRTAQLCSLAELCLDPYYRTIAGFRVLLLKEWEAFGHKFRDRIWGAAADEKSPVFFQFIDSVWQMLEAFPAFFQFNERLLLRLVEMMYANTHSDFRFNCERERYESREQQYVTVWDDLELDPACENQSYDASLTSVLRPPQIAKTWTGYFNRWSEAPLSSVVGSEPPAAARRRFTLEALLSRPVAHWSVNQRFPQHAAHSGLWADTADADGYKGRRMNPWSVIQEGWLYQRGRMGASKHRFFVLLEEGTLVYYETEGDSTALVPVDTIRLPRHEFTVTRLAQVAAMPGESKGRQTRFPFQIGIEGVVHILAADNADDFSDWFTCLQEQSGRRDTESTVLTPSRTAAGGGATALAAQSQYPHKPASMHLARDSGSADSLDDGPWVPVPQLQVTIRPRDGEDVSKYGYGVSGIANLSDGGVVLELAPECSTHVLRVGQRVVEVNGAPTQNKAAVTTALLNAEKAAREQPPQPPLKLGLLQPTTLDVGARRKELVTANLSPGQRLCWSFVISESSLSATGTFVRGGGGAELVVLPLTQFGEGCSTWWVQGSHLCETDGELTFEFDNSSSWFSGRAVDCMFSIGEVAQYDDTDSIGGINGLQRGGVGGVGGVGDSGGTGPEKERELQLTKAPGGQFTLWSL